MKKFELNSIRLPVGYWYFEEISGYTSAPYLMPKESIFSRMIILFYYLFYDILILLINFIYIYYY